MPRHNPRMRLSELESRLSELERSLTVETEELTEWEEAVLLEWAASRDLLAPDIEVPQLAATVPPAQKAVIVERLEREFREILC